MFYLSETYRDGPAHQQTSVVLANRSVLHKGGAHCRCGGCITGEPAAVIKCVGHRARTVAVALTRTRNAARRGSSAVTVHAFPKV
jgi:hypothetical protein